jgi:acyl-coenzyme A thioesterase PaaI-like protein
MKVMMRRMTENIAIQPATAEVQARIRASFARQVLMRHLGACLSDIGHGKVRIKLSASPEASQQHGYVRAGATAAIADTAGGYAALTMMPADSEVLTVKPAGALRARSSSRSPGATASPVSLRA